MNGLDELGKLADDSEMFWVAIIVGGVVLAALIVGVVVGAMVI